MALISSPSITTARVSFSKALGWLTQISYTFTANYEGTEKSITLKQDSALFELHASAYYMRGSEKVEDPEELDLKYDDSGYLYI